MLNKIRRLSIYLHARGKGYMAVGEQREGEFVRGAGAMQ